MQGGDIPISILTGHQEYPEHHHNQVGGFVSLFSGGLNGDCLRKFYFIALPEYFSRFPNIAKDYHNGTLTSASESIHLKIMCAFALLLWFLVSVKVFIWILKVSLQIVVALGTGSTESVSHEDLVTVMSTVILDGGSWLWVRFSQMVTHSLVLVCSSRSEA